MPARIGLLTYSTYGHIDTLAEQVAKGLESSGAIVERFAIQETLPEEVLKKMYAGGSLSPKYPIIKPDDLTNLDGFILGFPTRYGRTPAQVSQFFDQTGGLWMKGALVGKFGAIFTSTGSQHGGQETTALTTLPFFAHHGIIFVPLGYAHPGLQDNSSVIGGSAWGAGTVAGGDGSRQPSEIELGIAKFQGEQFGKTVGTFVKGREFLSKPASAGVSSLALGRALPVTQSTNPAATKSVQESSTTQNGYTVPDPTADTSNPVTAQTTTPGPTPATIVVPAPVPAAAPGAPEAGPTVPIKQVEKSHVGNDEKVTTGQKKKKKGGLFGCCGDSNID